MKNFYQKSSEEVLKELEALKTGLSSDEASIRFEKNGPNALLEQKPPGALKVFLQQFQDLLVIILIIAALISYISGEKESTIVIVAVITLNAILGTVQTLKAQKSLASLKSMSAPTTRVFRDNQLQEINSYELTLGDIMLLEAGDVVGADGRIIDNHTLQVNESALTGEVESVNKTSDIINEVSPLGDQKNMVFSSGLVTYGRATCVVTGIGMGSEIGKIANLLNSAKERKTPLQLTLDEFSKKLSIGILLICILVFGLSLYHGEDVIGALMFAVALAVAAIPEALASIVTIVLAMGTNQMAKENAIMKNINSVESLGCVSIICSDKTGTLTQNKMSAQQIYTDLGLIQASELHFNHALYKRLSLAFALCNDSHVNNDKRMGDPTELAFVDLLNTHHQDVEQIRKEYIRLDENPFDSERKLMATLHKIDNQHVLLLKGACDEILKKTKYIHTDNGVREISEDEKDVILKQNILFAQEGLRVLGFAYKDVMANEINVEDECDLTYIGIVSLMDPPRLESKEAVRKCLLAGITPIMITGDHKITAKSIAKALGIYQEGDRVVDGVELSAMSEVELQRELKHIHVYARVAPEDKIRIVNAWQEKGNICAMTGDGVNDAPALKQSDIGIAMGITGTQVSKDAASMILTDDNFATIVKAVATGRNIYTNIKNAIIYLLSGNLSGIICVLSASLINLPVPFYPVHLLFINLVTDSLPAIAIGMEKAGDDILKEKPRDPSEGILTKESVIKMGYQGILIAIATMIAYFIGLSVSNGVASTMAFSTLCLARLLHGFNCRSKYSLFHIGLFSNMYSIAAFIVGFIFLNGILLLPSLHSLFSISDISIMQLYYVYGLALAPTIIIQIVKVIQEHLSK